MKFSWAIYRSGQTQQRGKCWKSCAQLTAFPSACSKTSSVYSANALVKSVRTTSIHESKKFLVLWSNGA